MSYLVTARKWRPRKFSEVVGQQHITQTLKNAILNDRIAHAYLFAGPRGVGKTTTARIMAKVLNCQNPKDGEPCNECEMCKSFNSSQSLDIIEIDGASNRRIEEIRTLRESVKYAPTKGMYKVYIIDEVHMLTLESFNALLKTLEEPPEHTIFIFATTDVHKVPVTIISRCQRYDFRRIELNTIKDLLKKIADAENIKIDDKSLTIVAKKADGALRDAQSIFDQVISFCGSDITSEVLSSMLNLIDDEIYFNLTDAILEKKFEAAFDITKELYNRGWNFIDFVNGITEHLRNILSVVIKKDPQLIESAEVYKDKYLEYISKFTEADVLRLLTYANKLSQELRYAQNQRIKIEISLAEMIGLEKTETISNLIELIKKRPVNLSPDVSTNQSENNPEEKKKPEPVTTKPVGQNTTGTKSKQEEPKKENKYTGPITLKGISAHWKRFISVSSFELNHQFLIEAKPMKYLGDELTLKLSRKSDYDLVNGKKEFLNTLREKTKSYFGKEINCKIVLPDNAHPEEVEYFTSNQPATELVEAVINVLGASEYK